MFWRAAGLPKDTTDGKSRSIPSNFLLDEIRKARLESDYKVYLTATVKTAMSDEVDDAVLKKAIFKRLKLSGEATALVLPETEADEPSSEPAPQPPSGAILSALLPTSESEDILANLDEVFGTSWVPRYGPGKARWVWRVQVGSILVRRLALPLLSFLDRLRRLSM